MSSQERLAPNLEEKSKGTHCHLENKAWVNFVQRQTSCLSSPACRTCSAPHQQPLRMAPYLLNHSLGHPHRRPGVWPHTQTSVPPDWAWPGPSPRPSQNYIPPWARAVSPVKLSSISTRPGLIPRRVHNPLSGKKGAAGIDKFKVCPPGPPAALHPTAILPGHFQGINRPKSTQSSVRIAKPSVSSTSSFYTIQGTGGALGPRRSGTLPDGKLPFSNRQQQRLAWKAAGLEGCRPPPRSLRALQRSFPRDTFPKT